MQTLILIKAFNGSYSLQDSAKHHLGWFQTIESAQTWCKENGYRLRIQ